MTPDPVKFCVRVRGHRIRVWVYDSLKGLRAEFRRVDGRPSRIYAFVSRGCPGGLRVCFWKGDCTNETLAHEALHLAFGITGDWKKKTCNEEKLARWTGRIFQALVKGYCKRFPEKEGE